MRTLSLTQIDERLKERKIESFRLQTFEITKNGKPAAWIVPAYRFEFEIDLSSLSIVSKFPVQLLVRQTGHWIDKLRRTRHRDPDRYHAIALTGLLGEIYCYLIIDRQLIDHPLPFL